MANLLERIKNLLAWSQVTPHELMNPTPETIERWRKVTEPFVVKGNGNGAVLPLMNEEEMTQHLRETDLGWGKVYDKVRNLTPKEPDGE